MILKILNFSQLQTFNHVLQIMEEEGLTSLSDCRLLVNKEMALRLRDKKLSFTAGRALKKDPPMPPTKSCPECGKKTTIIPADGLLIRQCASCRWSAIEVDK